MAKLNLSVVTPRGAVVDTTVEEVEMPGAFGEMGVLPEHQPGLIMLGGGLLTYSGGDGAGRVYVRGGVAEVGPTRVLILTDEACLPGEADREAIEGILERSVAGLDVEGGVDEATSFRLNADRAYAEAVLKSAGN